MRLPRAGAWATEARVEYPSAASGLRASWTVMGTLLRGAVATTMSSNGPRRQPWRRRPFDQNVNLDAN